MLLDLIRSPLRLMLSGLLLAACGGDPEAGLSPAEELLGTREAALCSGLSVSSLSINGVSSWGGEMAGNGGWGVSGGANAVRLEYRVDGVLRSSEERTGNSGTWYFSTLGTTCGSHTFEVKAYPMVIDSAGNRTTCWDSYKLASQSVVQDCPTASVTCSRSSATVTCTGTGSGGTGGYTPFWKSVETLNSGATYSSSWFQGAWTESFYCGMKTSTEVYNGDLTVQFKVRDNSGMESAVVSRTYLCVF